MPIDPGKLARIRARVIAAAALLSAGCPSERKTINEPNTIHDTVNEPPDDPPPASSSASPSAAPPETPPENG